MLADKLYEVLEEGKMLGKACKRRSVMLKTIFRLLDLESPKLLLKLARLILAVSEFLTTGVFFQCKTSLLTFIYVFNFYIFLFN